MARFPGCPFPGPMPDLALGQNTPAREGRTLGRYKCPEYGSWDGKCCFLTYPTIRLLALRMPERGPMLC
jgi:hypothetical protein